MHLKVDMDNPPQAQLCGGGAHPRRELPDEWIVLGNHRDAWEFGGVDPSSGTASMMEMTRALGQMKAQGFRPRRTLVVCSWDGEEVGLTGSTEWGEQFADELEKAGGVSQRGLIHVRAEFRPQRGGSLAPLLVETTKSLHDPSGKSLYDAWMQSSGATGKKPKTRGRQ